MNAPIPAPPHNTAQRQAAALRRLAVFLERHPRFGINDADDGLYLWRVDDAQVGARTLTDMIHAAHYDGIAMTYTLEGDYCDIALDFGALTGLIITTPDIARRKLSRTDGDVTGNEARHQ